MSDEAKPDEPVDPPPIVAVSHVAPAPRRAEDPTPLNEGAYGPSARLMGEFEPLSLDELAADPPAKKVDPYLGDTMPHLMAHGEGGERPKGSGSRSGKRVRKKTGNKPTEQQQRESNLRRDQEADFLRPAVVSARVTEDARRVIQAQRRSWGKMNQTVAEALMRGATYDEIESTLNALGAKPEDTTA